MFSLQGFWRGSTTFFRGFPGRGGISVAKTNSFLRNIGWYRIVLMNPALWPSFWLMRAINPAHRSPAGVRVGDLSFGRRGGKVRRPCHNLVRDCENSGKRFPACSQGLDLLVPVLFSANVGEHVERNVSLATSAAARLRRPVGLTALRRADVFAFEPGPASWKHAPTPERCPRQKPLGRNRPSAVTAAL